MSRAFVLEPCEKDVSRASQFGPLVYLFRKDESRSSIWDREGFAKDVATALQRLEFDVAKDAFVVAGKIVPLVLAMGTLLKMFGRLRLLLWSASERDYVEREL